MTKNLKQSANKKGQVNFRGFYGKYQIKVTKLDGSTTIFDAHLAEKANNHWEFNL